MVEQNPLENNLIKSQYEGRQPEERIYCGNPALSESYILSLKQAALIRVNVVSFFVYDPKEGLDPDIRGLIDSLRLCRVRVEAVPIPKEEWNRGITGGRDFVNFLDRYYLILPSLDKDAYGRPLDPMLTFLAPPELDTYWPFFEQLRISLSDRAERDIDKPTEKWQFLHSIVNGVFSNLDEEYKDDAWTTKKIAVLGAPEEVEVEVQEILILALQSRGVNVKHIDQTKLNPETDLSDLKEADVIISVTQAGTGKEFVEFLSTQGIVKDGVLVIEVQLEDSDQS